ncbi:MAG: NAD(P)/FAD-dependent oxidoreductase [Clostridiales bacterium]|nr:NAD(P)/FAD-dependent oxidoreductase [Clostridiales bacterium]
MYDVLIVGAGVIGCSIARELSRYQLSVAVVDKENDVAMGTSKANSGIVHAGFDAKTGTNKAIYNVLGARMFPKLAEELDFPYRRNGALVLCFDENSKGELIELLEQGKRNGVSGLSILDGDAVRKLEPNVSDKVVAALYAETSAIASPYEMTVALAENAATNGVEFILGSQVKSILNSKNGFEVRLSDNRSLWTKIVINCAGVYADEIYNIMKVSRPINIVARKGEYVLLDKKCGGLTDKTLFQQPTKMGKGVLVAPTTHGNVIVGPTAEDIPDKSDVDTTVEGLNAAFGTALLSVPSLSRRDIITQFAGLRAHSTEGDFVIGESEIQNFFNVAGIESPGLSAAPAIAVDVAEEVAMRLNAKKKTNFVARRKGIPCFARMSDSERKQLIDKNPLYGKIVCRCENVTEGEIVDSIRRPLGATDLDGVKRRTRAGMGRCQMGFCTPRIMEILSRELGKDMTEITKNGKGSHVVVGRTE